MNDIERVSMIEYRNRLWSQLGIDLDRIDRNTFDSIMDEYDMCTAAETADMITNDDVIIKFTVRDLSGLHMVPLYLIIEKIRKTKTEG